MNDAQLADELRSVYRLIGSAWTPFDFNVAERKERLGLYWFTRAGLIEQRMTGRAWAGSRSIRFQAVVSGAWVQPDPVVFDGIVTVGREHIVDARRQRPVLEKIREHIRDWEFERVSAQLDPVVYARMRLEGETHRQEINTCEFRLIWLLEQWTKPAKVGISFLGPMESWPVLAPDLTATIVTAGATGGAAIPPSEWGDWGGVGGGAVQRAPAASAGTATATPSPATAPPKKHKPRLKRADRAAAIERLQDCLQEHIRGQVDALKGRAATRPPALTQKLLGKLTGLSQATVSRCLRDKKAVMLKMLWLEQQKPEPSLYRWLKGRSGGQDEDDREMAED